MRFAFFAALRPHLFVSMAAFLSLAMLVQEPVLNKRLILFIPTVFLYFASIALFAWEKKVISALMREAKSNSRLKAPRPEAPSRPEVSVVARPLSARVHIPKTRKTGFHRI